MIFSPLWSKFHPEIHWKEIKSESFIVIYPEEYLTEAIHTLKSANDIYDQLMLFWRSPVRGKIRILLHDSNDFSNGSASFFPFNHIEIFLFHPPPHSELGNCKDWIRLVLSHEISHILNMNSGSRFIFFLRSIFGHNPLLFPMQQTPVWMIEGIAILSESKLNPGGRLNSPDFNIILSAMARGNKIPTYRTIYGDPTYWPGPNAKYIFGATFFRFLAQKYGEDKIVDFVKYYTSNLISISSSHRFRQFFQQKLSHLWHEFITDIKPTRKEIKNKINVLTTCGMSKKFPLTVSKNRAFFVFGNYKKLPGIYDLDLDTGQFFKLVEKWGINGLSYSQEENTLYLSAVDFHDAYYIFSDLYKFNLDKKKLVQLTKGKRLYSPVKRPGSPEIFCIKRSRNRSHLAIYDPVTKSDRILSDGYIGMDNLTLSPDGDTVAVSVKIPGGVWHIALFHSDGTPLKILPGNGGKDYNPVWRDPNTLFFVSQFRGNYCLATYNQTTDESKVFSDPDMPAIKFVSTSPDTSSILISYFDENGFNLGIATPENLHYTTMPAPSHTEATPDPPDEPTTSPKKYRRLRDLLPKYFSPYFRYAGNEFQPGITSSGNDLLSAHAYIIEGFYGIRTKTYNFNFSYTYDGWYPTFILNLRKLTDLNRHISGEDYTYTNEKAELVGLFPILRSERYRSHLYTNVHFERFSERSLSSEETQRTILNGIKIGFLYNSAQRFYDSFSQSDGISFSLSYSRDFEFLGSDFDLNTAAFEYRQYLPLARPNVLALRFGISDSWGAGNRIFMMGGATPQLKPHIAGENLFDLMRGYPSGYFSGSGGIILNLEYRISLAKMERSIIISRSLDRLFLSVFTDIGNLWGEQKLIDLSYSFGIELSTVLYVGGRATISGGVAVGRNPNHPAIFYLRFGEAF